MASSSSPVSALRRSPARRHRHTLTIDIAGVDVARLTEECDRLSLQQSLPYLMQSPTKRKGYRRPSDGAAHQIIPPAFLGESVWPPAREMQDLESTHVLEEIVASESSYLRELRGIYDQVIRPHKSTPPVSPAHELESPVLYLGHAQTDRLFRSTEALIRHHSALLSAFLDSCNPLELVSAFSHHLRVLEPVYAGFVLVLPHAKLGTGLDQPSSRMLAPLQRVCRYELLLERLLKALRREKSGSIELEKLVEHAVGGAKACNSRLDKVRREDESRRYLRKLCHTLAAPDLLHCELVYEGGCTSEHISGKRASKVQRALLFSDGTVFFSDFAAGAPTNQVSAHRRTRSAFAGSASISDTLFANDWYRERVLRIEEGTYLDLVVHTLADGKLVRRAIGFPPEKLGPMTNYHVRRSSDNSRAALVDDWLQVGKWCERRDVQQAEALWI
ncbi:hypothetical protein PYCC9005_005672 [Savitreella phatthalungensis]